MVTTVRALARKTATGTKVYIHAGCTCRRFNGAVVKGVDTVEAAEAYAAGNSFPSVFCKTSVKPAEEPTADVPVPVVEEPEVEEAPAAPAPAVEEPAVKPARKKRTPKKTAETAPAAQGPSFTVEVNNRDSFGSQRRKAVQAIAAALGATTTHTSIKNKNKTGDDAFIVTVTGGKPDAETIIKDWLNTLDGKIKEVARKARAEAKTAEGATSATIQKAIKTAVRAFITTDGQDLADACATIK